MGQLAHTDEYLELVLSLDSLEVLAAINLSQVLLSNGLISSLLRCPVCKTHERVVDGVAIFTRSASEKYNKHSK